MADQDPNPTPSPAPSAAPAPAKPPLTDKDKDEIIAEARARYAAERVERQKERERADQAEKNLREAKEEADKRVTETESKYKTVAEKQKDRIKKSEIKAQAAALGLVDMDLLPLIRTDGIEIDDDGNVTGVEEAVKAFKEAKPSFFGDKKTEPKAGDPPVKKTGGKEPPAADPKIAPKSVKTMTPEEYRQAKKEELAKIRNKK